jgi:iron complex transport system substrate-binding protein
MSFLRSLCISGAVAFLALAPPVFAGQASSRIVSVGGALTEIVFALGQQHRLIARDTTSVYPAEARDLPDVGYMRRLSPEGVLAVNPDLILTEPGSGPVEAIEILEEAGIEFVDVPGDYSAEGILARIRAVSAALGVDEAGAQLAEEVGADLAAAEAAAHAQESRPRVMFILSMPGGRVNASGTGTRADGIITMSGGENAFPGFTQYRILSDEAIITAAPEVILMMDRGDDHGAANDELWAHPAIALTPAGQNRAVIRMDGSLMLGFGPRTAEAVRALSAALHGE